MNKEEDEEENDEEEEEELEVSCPSGGKYRKLSLVHASTFIVSNSYWYTIFLQQDTEVCQGLGHFNIGD